MGTVTQPPETQNVFLCLSVVVGLIWVFNSARRCWAVAQLRQALGSRRLVAIRGAGRRVRIFRLLGRSYLQRALGRNHLQALVHTRQAYPPKEMPCSLLLASDPVPSGGLKAILHPRDTSMVDDDAAGVVGAGIEEAGPLIGVSMVLDCRVDCTVELLWDVDLTLLGREMGLHPKLKLLLTGESKSRPEYEHEYDERGCCEGTCETLPQFSHGPPSCLKTSASQSRPSSRPARSQHEISTIPSPVPGAWDLVVSASRRLARGGRERWGRRVAGVPADSSPASSSVFRGWDGRGSGGAGGGYVSDEVNEGEGGAGHDAPPGLGAATSGQQASGLGWRSRRGRGVAGIPGSGMGLCGKRTVPRALSAGGARVFETLPGERRGSIPSVGGGGSASDASRGVLGSGATDGAGGRGGRRGRWPKVEDSVRAGRCSLAVVIRPAAGAERGDWAGWRHRPTHRVVRQVLLVQLAERGGAAGDGAGATSQQRPPSARCLRHLVAISKGGNGDAEAVYSFSEVFGASDEARGEGQLAPAPASAFGSVQATAGGGSSSTVGTGSNANHNNNGGNATQPAAPPPPQQQALPVSGGGDDVPEECVICLTDPKDTLLLPCRHLCVCTECFRHVDKCPVCRSAFDNYIVLAGPEHPEQQQQGPQVGGPAAASNTGAAINGGEGGAGPPSAVSALGRTATVFPLAGRVSEDGLPPQQQRQPTMMGSYSASLATAAASMLPTFSLPGRRAERDDRGVSGDDAGSGRIAVFPASPPAAAAAAAAPAVAGASSAMPARRNIFAVSRRRVPEG
ncbi:unnamed protein product [Scytosiphon promiscuus]